MSRNTLVSRLRMYLWAHQRKLAVAYMMLLCCALLSCFVLSRYASPTVDLGSVLAVRSMAFQETFGEVRIAQREVAGGQLEAAANRLQRFIDQHSDAQATTLYATAVGDSCELLVETHVLRGSMGKAEKTAALWTRILPRNYRAWYVLGRVRKERGDLRGAADALSNAFILTLCIPEVTETYLSLLADLNQYERIRWVAEQYTRSAKIAEPRVEVFVGVGRSTTQQTVMNAVGMPVGHGKYYVRFDTEISRGEDVIKLPREVFEEASSDKSLYVMLKLSNLFSRCEVVSMSVRDADGDWCELAASEYSVGSLRREHSGAASFIELKTRLLMGRVTGCEICITSPIFRLSDDCKRIIKRAEANLE